MISDLLNTAVGILCSFSVQNCQILKEIPNVQIGPCKNAFACTQWSNGRPKSLTVNLLLTSSLTQAGAMLHETSLIGNHSTDDDSVQNELSADDEETQLYRAYIYVNGNQSFDSWADTFAFEVPILATTSQS